MRKLIELLVIVGIPVTTSLLVRGCMKHDQLCFHVNIICKNCFKLLSSTQVHVRACCQMGSVPIILINSEKVSILMTFETRIYVTNTFISYHCTKNND